MLVSHGGPGAGFTQPAGLDERIGKKLLTLILTLTLTLTLNLILTLTLTLTLNPNPNQVRSSGYSSASRGSCSTVGARPCELRRRSGEVRRRSGEVRSPSRDAMPIWRGAIWRGAIWRALA